MNLHPSPNQDEPFSIMMKINGNVFVETLKKLYEGKTPIEAHLVDLTDVKSTGISKDEKELLNSIKKGERDLKHLDINLIYKLLQITCGLKPKDSSQNNTCVWSERCPEEKQNCLENLLYKFNMMNTLVYRLSKDEDEVSDEILKSRVNLILKRLTCIITCVGQEAALSTKKVTEWKEALKRLEMYRICNEVDRYKDKKDKNTPVPFDFISQEKRGNKNMDTSDIVFNIDSKESKENDNADTSDSINIDSKESKENDNADTSVIVLNTDSKESKDNDNMGIDFEFNLVSPKSRDNSNTDTSGIVFKIDSLKSRYNNNTDTSDIVINIDNLESRDNDNTDTSDIAFSTNLKKAFAKDFGKEFEKPNKPFERSNRLYWFQKLVHKVGYKNGLKEFWKEYEESLIEDDNELAQISSSED